MKTKDFCSTCKNQLKFSAEGTLVHAWKLYCTECYEKKIEDGIIIPPLHYKKSSMVH